MAREQHSVTGSPAHDGRDSVELPRPTVAPLVLSLGLALMVAGLVAGPTFLVVGGVILAVGVGQWVGQLLPGRGHVHEPLAGPEGRPAVVEGRPGTVQHLVDGPTGYRFRLPVEIHPISAGVKGGVVGGLVMPLPALVWGLLSRHGVWYPINLLAGMALPGIGTMSDAELEQFRLSLLLLGAVIHVTTSLVVGLIYGVLLPTLPDIPKGIAWGGLLMPILWTAVSFLAMGIVNPALQAKVSWPWFVASQFVFGITMPAVVLELKRQGPVVAGLLGGLVGGLAMALPALLWALASGNGMWYPLNLLAGMVQPGLGDQSTAELGSFHAEWFLPACIMHVVLSSLFGVSFALVTDKVPVIPGPMAWGALLMPLLWTGSNYALMGVVNPVLQQKVEWPWFIVSQFIFGLAASVVVVRSAKVAVAPAGPGPAGS